MKYFLCFLWAALLMTSCFDTRLNDAEEKRQQRIRDSIRTDSIETRRNTPDTTFAIYKRIAFCDTTFVVVFDRVKMLSGKEAAEYAQRHKRFDNTDKIIVNQSTTLETLRIAKDTPILLIDQDSDSVRYKNYKPAEIADNLPKEDLIQIVILHRSIVYLKQMP
ncbi:MAG: hypothetical protein J6T60_11415 [Bacteroidales bacterium]|nr:hypothetical protein [Bacteroidales bacterium]MBP5683297.1 hypothetical protein [Bacteroidales bacterium]